MQIDHEQIKKFLLDAGIVSAAELVHLEDKARQKNLPLGDVVVSEGKLAEDEYRRVEAHILGIPFVDLKNTKIERDVLSLVPEPVARTHNIVAYKRSGDALEVAMLDPQDLEAIEFIRKKLKLRIMPRLTDVESMRDALLQYQKSLKQEFGDIIERQIKMVRKDDEGEAAELLGKLSALEDDAILASSSTEDLKKLAEDLPIVRIVETLLQHAIVQHASDIHIEHYEKELLIRYRIDGILHDAMVLPPQVSPGIVARIKVLAGLRLDEKRLPQDGRFKLTEEHSGAAVAFRVSILPTYFGEKIVMRLLPESVKGFTLEGLGFHGKGLELLHEAIRQTTGMLLVTGPTGSGKSTTLYAILELVNTPEVNISTVEDPIEYQMARINQTQVKPEIGFSFSSGLRTLVRQDPDIIMVGEIRDKETATLSVNAALTGHLVLSTLHTNSAAGAIPRMLDMGVEAFLLSSTINLAVAQRLVRRLSDEKQKYLLSEAELVRTTKYANMDLVLTALKEEKIVDEKATWADIPFYKAVPSESAKDGYKGRLGIHEVLRIDAAIKELILQNASDENIQEVARKQGMMTMVEDGIMKAAQGLTTIEEVFRVANE
ncbi:MAG: hypothetical protein COV07_02765 [Candidatus Vogelbacteria bacterium CG10_big_fil_rev_8_21_14_0_10_45_14]|uniref:Bacterial type II secretion system protein E domain-containing protein n=1 Tax=Candidatus Vogelbacteria bacterium CG10_big_fil_rev_8_21_14_0_10_45_14 TaxID=1975042 RepID=A0A2H0RJM5_9BACT|nr:MAG: hypothetical protein COV07_02765 [Candidatus Vogelbacteria bacterium CG10_big_fil_rev_8_21_14_0_10_45_14]